MCRKRSIRPEGKTSSYRAELLYQYSDGPLFNQLELIYTSLVGQLGSSTRSWVCIELTDKVRVS